MGPLYMSTCLPKAFLPDVSTNWNCIGGHTHAPSDTHIVGVPDDELLLGVVRAEELNLGRISGGTHVLNVWYVLVVHAKDVVIVIEVRSLQLQGFFRVLLSAVAVAQADGDKLNATLKTFLHTFKPHWQSSPSWVLWILLWHLHSSFFPWGQTQTYILYSATTAIKILFPQ